MARRILIAGNWKMNGLIETARELADSVRAGLIERENRQVNCEVVVCPPFTALHHVHQALGSSALKLGAQNMSAKSGGAYTGEICGIMLRNVGCRFVILGHSERRQHYGETDAGVTDKVIAAYRDGLAPIVCVGESLAEREAGETLAVVERQVKAALEAVPEEAAKRTQMVIAYEPVWAIGTGKHATPDQAQEVHAFIRGQLTESLGDAAAQKIRILYGGSMNPDNAATLLALPDVDGGLIGGASLKAKDFLNIIDAVPASDGS